jgi:ATP-dependent helicase/nuclease subunit A
MNLKIISAGAGSGKTYRLTSEMVSLLASGEVRASGIIATTFTKKAAAELQERVRVRLLEEGLAKEANDLTNALIGTVHGLGVKLLKRFAFEAGVSPEVDIIADEDQQVMFNQSLAMVLTNERVEEMEQLANRLGLNKSDFNRTDWRSVLKQLTEVARANDFSAEMLQKSKIQSFESFRAFLDDEIQRSSGDWNEELGNQLDEAISRLENNGDTTKITSDGIKNLRELRSELLLRNELFWHQWVKISKTKVGAKSRDDLAPLVDFVNTHLGHSGFHQDVKSFIFNIFEIAGQAVEEYDRYKKSRGLIDYTDMEVLVKRLLDDPVVQEVLAGELDLLMVDEFQDTNPIQLEIFLKLSRFAKFSIWVGDPKQSIYGFRGAEPALMEAIIQRQGGLKKENILEHSWRSREDIVFATNAIFTRAFSQMPPEQVALQPKRRKIAGPGSFNKESEPPGMTDALIHWHFKYDGEGRKPGKEWLNQCLAETLRTNLERGMLILPKGEKKYRNAQPGDVAILCRSNKDCMDLAEALHKAGLRAAISRAGLLSTAEAKLILACLKFILNKYDSLSIAEILLLAARLDIEAIIEDRLDYLEMLESEGLDFKWGEQNEFIRRLNLLRPQVVELSGSEILTLLLEELDLRRIIVTWGNVEQRLANVDVLCSLAQKYEEACNRLHSAASLGGFLLWLNDLEGNEADLQGSGENPEAVNVITYHKSKGLEYPVTICHSLENTMREDVWGISLVSDSDEINLNDLLGNRWLRFWVNPYADQFKNTLLEERIEASPVKERKKKEAMEEEARLLYVGITRARDYLVFPSREKPTIWLNRVFHQGKEDTPALDANSSESFFEWDGNYLDMTAEVAYFPNDIPHTELPVEEVVFLKERNGKTVNPAYTLDPAHENQNHRFAVQILREESYAAPLQLPEVIERQLVGKAMKSVFMADRSYFDEINRAALAGGLLKRYEVEEFAEEESLATQSEAFWKWIHENLKPDKIYRNYPVRMHFQGRLFENKIDLMLETPEGLVLIFYSAFTGDTKARQKKVREMGAFLWYCRQSLQGIKNAVQVRTMVNFVLFGSLVSVTVKQEVSI